MSNTEYDASIRDLTGVDVRPTKDFPADPAGGEGFDNTGEALSTSPSLVTKYLAAAQQVADHLVLKPDGISFAPFPVTSYNERKKLTELAIVDFYENHNVDVDAYLEAAWRQRYGEKVGIGKDGHSRFSEKYLALVSKTLTEASSQAGFIKRLARLGKPSLLRRSNRSPHRVEDIAGPGRFWTPGAYNARGTVDLPQRGQLAD